jgi:hypothetical protein
MGEGGQRVFRTALGPLGTLGGAHVGGHIGAYAGDFLADKLASGAAKAVGKALGGETEEQLAAKTAANRQALEGLLLNPQRLSHAMSAVSGGTAKTTDVMNGLLSRVAATEKGAGLLGALAAGQLAGNRDSGKRN